MKDNYKLSDEVIFSLVKMLQLAMLTGTDITDWFRMMQLKVGEDNKLVLDPNYESVLEGQIDTLENEVNDWMSNKTENSEEDADKLDHKK